MTTAQPVRRLRRTIYICILNFKGGVGKTTTAIHLGYYFALKLGYRVLLIDCDFQANSSSGLLQEIEAPTLTHVLRGEEPLHKAIRPARENLFLVPADSDLDTAAKHIISSGMGGYTLLSRSLKALEKGKQGEEYQYDIVIFDNASLNAVTESALYASDAMVIPVEMQFFSYEGLYVMIEKLNNVMENIGHELDILGIIPYNIDERMKMTRQYYQRMIKQFETEVTSAIRTDATVVYAQGKAQTVFEYDERCNAAKDFQVLGDELHTRILDMTSKGA
jgi:chromosome partitioning protein